MSGSRLPLKSDFPSSLAVKIIPPSSGLSVNVLILLHGLGDTNESFATLGKNLNLPETVAISVQGINPIPSLFTGSDEPSFHWGDDVLFDEGKGEIDLDTGFKTSTKVLLDIVLKDVLMGSCGYPARNILFYGFGQGAMAALAAVAASDSEFGGLISIGGRLPASVAVGEKCKTPVLLCGGSKSTQVTRNAIDTLKERFETFEYVKWQKAEDSMPRSREEMLPIMKFLSRRLRSRAGVPDGAVEV